MFFDFAKFPAECAVFSDARLREEYEKCKKKNAAYSWSAAGAGLSFFTLGVSSVPMLAASVLAIKTHQAAFIEEEIKRRNVVLSRSRFGSRIVSIAGTRKNPPTTSDFFEKLGVIKLLSQHSDFGYLLSQALKAPILPPASFCPKLLAPCQTQVRCTDSGDKFRILDLLPGDEGDDIQCILRNASLGDGEQYEALSYVWGNQKNLGTVQVSGGPIEVTMTLFAALKRLRNQRATRFLWADQLCINQSDAKDKKNQVEKMRDIYRQCTQCVIWLGEIQDTEGITETDVEGAFDFIRLCAACSEDSQSGIAIPPGLSTPQQLERAYRAFKALILNGHSWWSRIWTVQEVILPQKAVVRWGSHSLAWSIIAQAASNLCSSRFPPPISILERFRDIIHDFTAPVRGLEISRCGENPLDLFQRWRYRGATEPRDKVYALLGLYPSMPLPRVQSCSYEISIVTLYTNVTIDLIELRQDLRTLLGPREKYTSGLPTWVIDLAGSPNVDTTNWWWNQSHRYKWFKADGGEPLRWETLHKNTALSLTGVSVDIVEVVGEVLRTPPGQYASDKQLVETMQFWEQLMISYIESRHLERNYPNGDSWNNAFWSTMIGDLVMREFPVGRGGAGCRQLVLEFYKNGAWSEIIRESLHDMIVHQSFFITKKGYIGIGPATAVNGDEVWVLFGAKVPFILRPNTKEERKDEKTPGYALVGNAFVYGIMDGEVVNLHGELRKEIHIY